MKRRAQFFVAATIALTISVLGLQSCKWKGEGGVKARHVILISVDTLRRDRLPIYGHPRDTAPNLTAFAGSAVVFDNAVAAAVNTAPSHASILTGLYPVGHGVFFNGSRLLDTVNTLGEKLKAHGFHTAGFVSSHTMLDETTGLGRGFDLYSSREVTTKNEKTAEQTCSEVEAWIHAVDPNRPFLLFVHLFDPHYPYRSPASHAHQFLPPELRRHSCPGYGGLHEMRSRGMTEAEIEAFKGLYDGEVLYADSCVGRLFDTLKSRGHFEHSLVIFLSDHGETLDERFHMFDHGGQITEEQVRIPLVVRFPEGEFAGRRVSAEVHHIDILPTILHVLNLPVPDSLPGRSLKGMALRSESREERRLFTIARSEPSRIPALQGRMERRQIIDSVRLMPYKLVRYPTGSDLTLELFNLDKDPGETENIAGKEPEVTERLHRRLKVWSEAGGGKRQERQPAMSPEEERGLRALGYIQ